MILNFFLCAYWPLVCLLWIMSIQLLYQLFLIGLFVDIELYASPVLVIRFVSFFHSVACLSFWWWFHYVKIFSLQCNLLIFLLISWYVSLGKGKILLELMSVSCLCFLLEFIVSGLTFICLIHCEFHASKICWRDYPLSIVCSLLLWCELIIHTCGLISELSIIFHWSMLSVCLPITEYFDYYNFVMLFAIRDCDTSSFALLSQDSFGYWRSPVVPYKL